MSINVVTVEGRISIAPDIKEFTGGGRLVTFGIAWNNRYLNKQTETWESVPNYFDVVSQTPTLVDGVVEHLNVGDLVVVHGQLRYRSWEYEGKKASVVQIYAFDIVKAWGIRVSSDEHKKAREGTPYASDTPENVHKVATTVGAHENRPNKDLDDDIGF